MRLTPADVHNVAFKKPSIGKRGYDEDEVDAFLDLVEAELSRLIEENNDLTQRLAAYESGGVPTPNQGGMAGLQQRDAMPTGEQPAVREDADAQVELAKAEQPVEQPAQPEPVVAQAPVQQAAAGPADHHVHAARLLGLAEETAQRLTSEAQAEAEKTRNDAKSESEKLVNDARSNSEQMLSDAKNRSEQMVNEATAKAEATTRDSQLKAEAMEREAQRKYSEVMDRLNNQRAGLEKKIDDLRTYEREYRSRLKGWITEQLAQLEDNGAPAQAAGAGAAQDGSGPAARS